MDKQERGAWRKPGAALKESKRLAFGELEPLASALLTVLLALVLARITGEEASLLELGPKFPIKLNQGAGDTETDRIGLTGDTATVGENQNIELVGHLGDEKGLTDRNAPCFRGEVVIEGTTVDGNIALAGAEEYAGDGRFPATGPKVLLNLRCWHSEYLSLSVN